KVSMTPSIDTVPSSVQTASPRHDAPLRLAVAGGRRGQAFRTALASLESSVQLTAVCDSNPTVLASWAEHHPMARAHLDYEDLLADETVDAIFLATPMGL